MADDQIQRTYRPNSAPARSGGNVSATGSDPLAELARLIGQTDPFAEYGREKARRPAPAAAAASTPPNFGPADYFDAPSAAPPRPAPLQPPPAYAPPPIPARQPYAAAPGAFPPPGAPAGFGTDAYHLGQPEHTPDDAGYYEDPPQPKRRIGVIALAAVLALAVIGAAGAFGYRAMFGGSRSSAPPPVIKADTAPIKVLPAAGSKTPSKLITDRIGDQAAGEKLVSREERPVAIPAPQGNGQAGAAMPAPGTGVIATEPKKVHTIVIHPDQMGDGQQAPVAAAVPPPPPRTTPLPAASNPPPAPVAAPPPRPVEARTAAPAQGAVAARGNAPLSLNPDAPAARTMRTAAAAAAAAAPAPAPQPAHANGGYAVQVSSQRSEAEAEAAFRGLQAKYPNILGSQHALIHKVELGAKGTYYRAMVGPFANANEATELCNGLKAAGASCLIQRN